MALWKKQIVSSILKSGALAQVALSALDEIGHATFLNAYLESKGAEPVNLDRFRIQQGSKATGAHNIGRLTNLMHLNVDTSWFIRLGANGDVNARTRLSREF